MDPSQFWFPDVCCEAELPAPSVQRVFLIVAHRNYKFIGHHIGHKNPSHHSEWFQTFLCFSIPIYIYIHITQILLFRPLKWLQMSWFWGWSLGIIGWLNRPIGLEHLGNGPRISGSCWRGVHLRWTSSRIAGYPACARCTQATDSAALSPTSWKIFCAWKRPHGENLKDPGVDSAKLPHTFKILPKKWTKYITSWKVPQIFSAPAFKRKTSPQKNTYFDLLILLPKEFKKLTC